MVYCAHLHLHGVGVNLVNPARVQMFRARTLWFTGLSAIQCRLEPPDLLLAFTKKKACPRSPDASQIDHAELAKGELSIKSL